MKMKRYASIALLGVIAWMTPPLHGGDVKLQFNNAPVTTVLDYIQSNGEADIAYAPSRLVARDGSPLRVTIGMEAPADVALNAVARATGCRVMPLGENSFVFEPDPPLGPDRLEAIAGAGGGTVLRLGDLRDSSNLIRGPQGPLRTNREIRLIGSWTARDEDRASASIADIELRPNGICNITHLGPTPTLGATYHVIGSHLHLRYYVETYLGSAMQRRPVFIKLEIVEATDSKLVLRNNSTTTPRVMQFVRDQ